VISAVKTLGDGLFRVEWLGQVLRGTVTSVSVVFAPWQINSDTGEMGPAAGDHRTVAVPIAYLRMFRIGDLWQNGVATGHRDLQARQTFSLSIQDGAAQVMPAGVPLEGTSGRPVYPLPFSVFAGHRENTQSHCVRLAVGNNLWLVIPCLELVRFYFGGSGSFLKRLFSGAFALDKLYKRCQFNSWTRTARVELADDLSGAAAATIARIALNTQAKRAASWIVNSAVAASANRLRYHPKTTFPFFGNTELTVDGRWIEQQGFRIFLAEQIVRCTHPFPFVSLYYTTTRSHVSPKPQSNSSQPPPPRDEAATAQAESVVEDITSDAQLQPASIPLDSDVDPFPDLAGKKVRRIKQDGHGHSKSAETPELAAGNPVPSGEAREAEATDGFDETLIEEAIPDAAEEFEKTLGLFQAASRTSALPVKPKSPHGGAAGGSVFVRADKILGIQAAEAVWCALIEIQDVPHEIAVVVRGSVSTDVDDHITLLSIRPDPDQSDLKQCLSEFLAHPSNRMSERVLETLTTKGSFSKPSTLRTLSLALGRVLRGPTLEEESDDDSTVTHDRRPHLKLY